MVTNDKVISLNTRQPFHPGLREHPVRSMKRHVARIISITSGKGAL